MFYDQYAALCKQKGVSCSRAAEKIGLSNSTVTKWKKTGATPTGETLAKVAFYFGISTDELLGIIYWVAKTTYKRDYFIGSSLFCVIMEFFSFVLVVVKK